MGPKYEFTDETRTYEGHLLHRIRRLSDGKLGGWIEKEENLSQEGNCWVDGIVADDARVYGNAYVSGCVSGNARVYGNAKVYDDGHVGGNAHVFYNAKVYDYAWVSDNVQVFGDAQVFGHARVYGNAKVYDDANIFGNAKVFSGAIVYDYATVCSHAQVYGNAEVCGYAQVYGDAKVLWYAKVFGNAEVCGNAIVDYEISSGIVGLDSTDDDTEILKDFVYKIDDSSKLDVISNYYSIDAFFEDNSIDSYVEHECLTIVAVDTKVPIMKLEKAIVKNKKVFKFIVDITTEDDDSYSIKSIIDTKEKINQLLQSTINALKEYPQFIKYADEIEDCL